MKKNGLLVLFIAILALGAMSYSFSGTWTKRLTVQQVIDKKLLKNGDIIFHQSRSGQSQAIQEATGSRYSHCGLIFIEKGQYYVYEAVKPVRKTPLTAWIARGQNGKFVVKRLRNADEVLTEEMVSKMKKEGMRFMGKPYDGFFGWTDDRIYCSELVWKIYQRTTGLEVGVLQKLGDFNLGSEEVKVQLNARYHGKIPLEEQVISPAAIFESDLLVTVVSG